MSRLVVAAIGDSDSLAGSQSGQEGRRGLVEIGGERSAAAAAAAARPVGADGLVVLTLD